MVNTIPALAGKCHLALRYSTAYLLSSGVYQLGRHIHLGQIQNSAAVIAEEMHMGLGVAVESLHTFHIANRDRQASCFYLKLLQSNFSIHSWI